MFKRWIHAVLSIGKISIQEITQLGFLILIYWILIYLCIQPGLPCVSPHDDLKIVLFPKEERLKNHEHH